MVVKEEVKYKYKGESGSNGYSRGGEQCVVETLSGCTWRRKGGIFHESDWDLLVLLGRQVNEGVRIKRSSAQLMNRKGEFHQHQVVRVVPMRGLNNEPGEMAESRGRGRGQAGRRSSRDGERPESINYSDMIFFLTISHFFVLFFWRRVD